MERSMLKRVTAGSLLLIVLLAVQVDSVHAQAIRKSVDANGVTYFTNEPPENDPPAKPKAVASVPVAAASAESGKAPPSRSASSASSSKLAVTSPSAVGAEKPTPTQTAPAKLPLNPTQALGDWPPKSLQIKPLTPN